MKRIFIATLLAALLLGGCAVPKPETAETMETSPVTLPAEETADLPTTAPTTAPTTPPTQPPTEEPTQPPTEPIQPMPEPQDGELVRVVDYIPSVRQELAYATKNNFTGKRIYDFTDAYLRYGTIKKLKKAAEELEQLGYGILIWDGFRPVSAQAMLWEAWPDPAYVSHPVTGTRAHCRGNAVDMTLVDLQTGEKLEMPTEFDDFSAKADRDYSDCTEEAADNARLLEDVMKKWGFKPYGAEWWHFTDTVAYPVDEYFDPLVPNAWYAAEERVHMRVKPAPGQPLVATLLEGKEVRLQDWAGEFAKILGRGMVGYAPAYQIQPCNEQWLSECFDTVMPAAVYSYEQMNSDLKTLEKRHPDRVAVEIIGTSELGREIPVLRIGKEDAKYHVLMQGAIHGREHMTAWLLMALADYWLDEDLESYGDVCYHIIPMANPDGVELAQTGRLTAAQQKIYQQDTAMGYTELPAEEYAPLWKANALGTDLNQNFPAGWERIQGRAEPSSERYRGAEPFDAAEARVLRDYTLRYDFDATLSYHASGSVIFYAYGSRQPVNEKSFSLANAVARVTGYQPIGDTGNSSGGFKDWAIDALDIPSLTIEIGCEDAPLTEKELSSTFVRNIRIFSAVARWLTEGTN